MYACSFIFYPELLELFGQWEIKKEKQYSFFLVVVVLRFEVRELHLLGSHSQT
jgi:hypothetical protein